MHDDKTTPVQCLMIISDLRGKIGGQSLSKS